MSPKNNCQEVYFTMFTLYRIGFHNGMGSYPVQCKQFKFVSKRCENLNRYSLNSTQTFDQHSNAENSNECCKFP